MIPQAVTPPEPTLNWQVRRVIESVDAGRERARDVLVLHRHSAPIRALTCAFVITDHR